MNYFVMKRHDSGKRLFSIFCYILIFTLVCFQNVYASENSTSQKGSVFKRSIDFITNKVVGPPSNRGFVPPPPRDEKKVEDSVWPERIAQTLKKQLFLLSTQLNKTKNIRLDIGGITYDKKFKRFCASFQGKVFFGDGVPLPTDAPNFNMGFDDNLSLDINFEKLDPTPEGIGYSYEGCLVITLDNFIKDFALYAAGGVVAIGLKLPEQQLNEFFQLCRSDLLAQTLSKTFKSFSNQSIVNVGDEVISDPKFKESAKTEAIKGALKRKSLWDYTGLLLLQTIIRSAASIPGASLGAMIGSIVAPGPGTIVGAFLGAEIFSKLTKIVFKKVVDILTIDRMIRRTVDFHASLQLDPNDEYALAELEKYRRIIVQRIKHGLDRKEYSEIDRFVHRVEKLDNDSLPAFFPFLNDVCDLLSNYSIEGDIIAKRKLSDIRTWAGKVGISEKIGLQAPPNPENCH
ncbi:MAG: hypothetical protein HQM08_19565 [Candidatus Riflebacteria bacterium]|nr:hypothetical protein [Candidatus Riflebacteria bacterium]